MPAVLNASHADHGTACHGVRSHPVPVALVGKWLHTLSRRTWPASHARHTESTEGRSLGGASPQRCVQSQPTSPATCGESGGRGRRRAAGEWRTRRLPGGTGRLVEHGLLDNLIRPSEYWRRDLQTKLLRRLEVDHQFELGWLLDGKVSGLGAFEDLVHIGGGTPIQIGKARSIRHETTHFHELPPPVHRRNEQLRRQFNDSLPPA